MASGPNSRIDSGDSSRSDQRIDLTSQIINGYRILHRLGSGGMADVYLAFHEQLQRHVALKVMRADLSASKDHIQRFLQEARSAASLIHPNIVQVYDIGSLDKLHYIAQEYIAGNTLRSLIQRRNSLSQPEAMSIMMQIAAALQKASSIGVVHRDIKPDNVLLTPDGEVKVADFGLARVRSQNLGLTEIGVALGTPTYMSPEQIQGQAVDARSDLYSLGASAYEMLSGRPPFEGETALALALQHLQNPPKNLKELRPDIDDEFNDLIMRLLHKSPEDRFDSAAELLRTIKKIADRLSISMSLDHPIPLAGIKLDQIPVIGPHTTQLQTIAMRSARTKNQFWSRRLAIPLIGLATCLAVAIVIRNLGSRPLIRPPSMLETAAVSTKPDIRKQYFQALMSDKPIDWRAVENKFAPDRSDPVNINYNIKAWIQYSWHAIDAGKFQEARETIEKIFKYVDNAESVEFVLASVAKGMVTLYEKNQPASNQCFNDAQRVYNRLSKDEQELVRRAMPRSASNLWDAIEAPAS